MKKQRLGQFFTKKEYWMEEQVVAFINMYKFDTILDPFAGEGDLLKQFSKIKKLKQKGFDIDKTLKNRWKYNDSLKKIPNFKRTFVLTNPPFLSRSSNKRKKINHSAFENSNRSDLYLIALDKLIESKMPGVVIIPESFINSNFDKSHFFSITILIPNPFKDTETPICIACYDPNKKFNSTKIYKNKDFLGYEDDLKSKAKNILKIKNQFNISFNNNEGKLALIAYDSNSENKIRFLQSKNLEYKNKQKKSSRVISKIQINKYVTNSFVSKLNDKLENYRKKTEDVFLTPFKGNDKFDIRRRRRLDYKTARKIINSIRI